MKITLTKNKIKKKKIIFFLKIPIINECLSSFTTECEIFFYIYIILPAVCYVEDY
jgi:hypothetical protein